MLVESCVFNMLQMGELAHKLSAQFTDSNPQIPWRVLYSMRNRIVHNYEGVNFDLIWDIIKNNLPGLLTDLKKIGLT